jgi:hypothetical protein
MAIQSLADSIAGFFSTPEPGANDALVFTTFGLDEAVLTELLQRHEVSRKTRIVVFHDVMKHRHPGLLRRRFPNSATYAIVLRETADTRTCPIFHAKLWMRISPKGFVCRRLAVQSFNLTRYHLDQDGSTLESSLVWTGLALPVPRKRIFSRRRLFEIRGTKRLQDVVPFTFVVEANERTLKLTAVVRPPSVMVRDLVQTRRDPVRACAGPLPKWGAIRFLADLGRDVRAENPFKEINVYGDSRAGTALHAKLIECGSFIVAGSANLSCQALGLRVATARAGGTRGITSDNLPAPVNCEAIVLLPRPRGFALSSKLKGFPRLKGVPDTAEAGGDVDPDDDADTWLDQRRLASVGPVEAQLVLVGGKAQVHFKQRLGLARTIAIEAPNGDALRVAAARRLVLPRDEQQRHLAALLCHDRVTISGFGHTEIWRLELDLGEMWTWFQHHGRSTSPGGRTTTVSHEGGSREPRRTGFNDVRERRQRAYSSSSYTAETKAWDGWWQRYGKTDTPGSRIPDWCIDLAAKLHDLEGSDV